MATGNSVRVAVTQHEPVWLDLAATVDKTIAIIAEAAEKGAKLVAFPECWIPGYPAWIWSRTIDFDLGVKYVENCLSIDSPHFERIRDAAAEHSIAVALGFSERCADSVYIAQALITATGEIGMTRRKMKATHMERTIFGDASGECLAPVVALKAPEVEGQEPEGKPVNVGSLSCWEHIQPLLKYYTFAQGEQVHVAAWPPLDACPDQSPGLYSMSAAGCRVLSQAYAMESQSFVLHCVTAFSASAASLLSTTGSPIMGTPSVGTSCVIGPDGRLLTPTEHKNEELIIADLDLSLVVKNKTFADASGHYSRPDLLWLGVDTGVKLVIRPNGA